MFIVVFYWCLNVLLDIPDSPDDNLDEENDDANFLEAYGDGSGLNVCFNGLGDPEILGRK